MFALGIRYLNGWSMSAADGAIKERPEWPPHPDRVFMALAATWFETGKDAEEGRALRWLEALAPPGIAASAATVRTTVVSYVPINDARVGSRMPASSALKKLKKAGLTVLPEHRPRQSRSFPVAIPHDPTLHLIWQDTELDGHRAALERLAAKVTHVGHSASLVQAWMEQDCGVDAIWEPTDGVAVHRLRVPSAGRLDRLARACNMDAWIAYHDLRSEIEQAQADLKGMKQPPRVAWREFPDAVLLAAETLTKRHPEYRAAKSGGAVAAANLVHTLIDETGIAAVKTMIATASNGALPVLVSAHAYERDGFNAIPAALARFLSERLSVTYDTTVVQINVVSHTGADGYGRLARQAAFSGGVEWRRRHVLVDDFVGQGGTLANLRGWVEKQGGTVVGAVGLTGKAYSAKLNPSEEQLDELRQKHGPDFEKWWREHFGHAFDCLTQSEARYLALSPNADTIRSRLAAAVREGGGRSHARSPREQREYIKNLTARLTDRFPGGQPPTPLRPVPGKWKGYGRPRKPPPPSVPRSVFDPRIVVLGIQGRRVALPATLKLIAALRGLLMHKCPEQPPPEWFSGHRPDGSPSAEPHLALTPLPFVGSQHADGRIMGLAVVLPAGLDAQDAGRCLEPIFRDAESRLPCENRLFSGEWIECTVEFETRERPPTNLSTSTWTAPSRVWASVTPVVLNRHYKSKDKWDQAADSVKDACEHIGLPRPREVLVHPVSRVEGVPHAREFPQLTRKRDGGRQSHTHVVVIFDEPVRGPLLLGAGRFRGYGLCRPMDQGDDGEQVG